MDHSIFVGDLAVDVTDLSLQEEFRKYFPSVRGAKVITDMVTNRSKGYGFVRFGDEDERNRSIVELQGHSISGRPVRVSIATAKRPATYDRPQPTTPGQPEDLSNTTLFIGALSSSVTEEELKGLFGRYGPIVYCKIPSGGTAPKNCAFVQFVSRTSAEQAMQGMHGQVIGGSAVRVSWGKNTTRPYTQQPTAAGTLPYYPSGAYAPSVPLPAYPAYHSPAVDAYAAYHIMGQPATDPYHLQAYQQKQEGHQADPGQIGGQNAPGGVMPVKCKPQQADIGRLNADYLERSKVSLMGHMPTVIDAGRVGVK